MDESCGYIEQVDDDTVFGFVSGKDLAANISATRLKEKERKFNGTGHHNRFRGFRRRPPHEKEEISFDSKIFTGDFVKNISLLDEHDEEDDPSPTGNFGSYISPQNNTTEYNHNQDDNSMEQCGKTDVL